MTSPLYDPLIAFGHFTRALPRQYQAHAVLALLWSRVDANTENPVAVLSWKLTGVVPTAARMRQIIADLQKAGAVQRAGRGYRLLRPMPENLDARARAQLADAQERLAQAKTQAAKAESLLGVQPATSSSPDLAAIDRRERKHDEIAALHATRRKTLKRLGLKPSDVRDVLAELSGRKPNNVRFTGVGAEAVYAAIDWFTDTGASVDEFMAVCRAAQVDPNSPEQDELFWLFAERYRAYRDGLATPSATPEPVQPVSRPSPLTCSESKRLQDLPRVRVKAWWRKQAGSDDADVACEVWSSDEAAARLLQLTTAEATQHLRAWQTETPRRSIADYFAELPTI
jgi:hypothetical protein